MTPLETQTISPDCVDSRGEDGAWEEAVSRLREVYDAQRRHSPELALALTLSRQAPPLKPGETFSRGPQ